MAAALTSELRYEPGHGLRQRPRSRALWTFADQALSSVSNVTLTLAVARISTTREFGGYATAYIAYVLFLQVSRAIGSEPLVVRFSASARPEASNAAGSGAAATLAAGTTFGLLMVCAGAVIGPPVETPALIFALGLPLLLLQDFWRYTFFAYGTPRAAAFNDALWLVIQVVAFVGISQSANASEVPMISAWVAGGIVCSIVGGFQAGVRPRPSATAQWFRSHRDLIPRYCAEVLLQRGAVQLTLYVVAGIVGLAAIGALRGAQTLVGPMATLYLGALLASVPEMARLNASGRPGMFRLASGVSASLAGLGGVWAAVLLLIPGSWGHDLLGQTWTSTRAVIVPFGVYIIAEGLIVGPWAGLRGLAAAQQSLRARAVVATTTAVLGCFGAFLFGGNGAAWGIALASVVAAGVWWYQFERGLQLQVRRAELRPEATAS